MGDESAMECIGEKAASAPEGEQATECSWVSKEFSKHLHSLPEVITKEFPEYGTYIGQLDKVLGLHGTGAFQYENGDIYEGLWDNNQRNGSGTCVFRDTTRYEGEWCQDRMEGRGVLRYTDGSYFEGAFLNNYKHGEGKKVYASGSVYQGEWDMGRKSGQGKSESSDGNVYTGGWADDNKNGYGSYRRKNRAWEYRGFWQDGRRHGHGQLDYANGDKYKGEFRSNVFHGDGTITYADGSHYSGEWESGRKHGEGTLVLANADKYSGYWRQGQRHGYGTQVYGNLDRYEGQWAGDKYNGQGTMTYFQRQQKYQGEFKAGRRHGKGKMIFTAGDVYEGSWDGDVISGYGTRRYPDGSTYKGAWSEGKRDGHGTLEKTMVLGEREGDSVWKYEGGFKEDTKHGDGVERFGATAVWVSYCRDRLAECFLKEAPTGLKQRKSDAQAFATQAWSQNASSASVGRGEVCLDVQAWRSLELRLVDDPAELRGIAVESPMVRALLKTSQARTPRVRGGLHLDASPDPYATQNAPYLGAADSPRLGSPARPVDGQVLSPGSGPAIKSPRSPDMASRSPLTDKPHAGTSAVGAHAAATPRAGLPFLPPSSSRPITMGTGSGPTRTGSGPGGGSGLALDNAAVKLQAQLAPDVADVGLAPLQLRPAAGTLARRRQERPLADRDRDSRAQHRHQDVNVKAHAARLQPLPGLGFDLDWGTPGPKIHLAKDDGPL